MALNKNGIFGIASFILTVLGIALILLGVLKYTDMAIGFSVAGIGFISLAGHLMRLKAEFNLYLLI